MAATHNTNAFHQRYGQRHADEDRSEYYWIKDSDGKESKIHVDKSRKLDKVVVGDREKDITDKGHTTTLQRDE